MSVPADTRVRMNREIFMPLIQGALSNENAVSAILEDLFPLEEVASQSWVKTVLRDLLYCLTGSDMVQIGVTSEHPMDGAGSGIGLRLRKALLLTQYSNISFHPLILSV